MTNQPEVVKINGYSLEDPQSDFGETPYEPPTYHRGTLTPRRPGHLQRSADGSCKKVTLQALQTREL